ncbi:hypothetical protein J5226_20655 [Lysobacter sp. K5869]|uniref:hypothetical protein n=1 Tax=Lysobacter sp. K5869 TaxID=2820808 RepID=UPI001C061360|nr:hypothetical protein [Lysobacter sp. K5869]QWP75988.1 hypothetical protein J5226_20655 [Lysobacter sp. K5869]
MNYPNFTAEIAKGKILLASAFLLALGIGCAYLLLRGPDPDSLRAVLRDPRIFYPMTALGCVLGLSMAALGAIKARGGSPLKAGPDGLDLNGAIRIKWSDIAGVQAHTDLTGSGLHGYKILLKDPERFLAAHRDHRFYKRMASANSTVGTPVLVYTNGLRFDERKFQEVVAHYLDEANPRPA